MKTEYTARLIGVPNLERPIQSISYSLSSICQWADLTVHKYNGSVEIYESTTRLLTTVTPTAKAITKTTNGNCQECNHSANHHLLTCRTGNATHGSCSYLDCRCHRYEDS